MASLRIATFNLENLGQRDPEGPTLEARVHALRPMLRRLRADVLYLQEVNAERVARRRPRRLRALEALLEDTPYADWPRACSTDADGTGPLDVHNLVVLSRLPIEDHRQVWHELIAPPRHAVRTAEPPAPEAAAVSWDRPIQLADLRLPGGGLLHVLNLHLRAPLAVPLAGQKLGPFAWRSTAAWAEGFFLAALKRAGQALEARLAIDDLFEREAEPLVAVAGDFNAEAREVPVRVVMATEEDTGNGDLAARALVAVERSLPASQRFSVLHHGAPQLLDHILVSRALLAHYRRVEIHNEALGDELVGYRGVERPPESFHAPLVAEFAFED